MGIVENRLSLCLGLGPMKERPVWVPYGDHRAGSYGGCEGSRVQNWDNVFNIGLTPITIPDDDLARKKALVSFMKVNLKSIEFFLFF